MRTVTPVIVVAVILFAAPARACNVPVFRYALEHWPAEPYQATLYHNGPLSAADLTRIEALEQASPTLVKLHSIDLGTQTCDDPPAQLPWLRVGYPVSARMTTPVWQGPLSDAMVPALLDSPKRRDLTRRLLAGDSAVWVLLESGQADADDAVATKMEAHARHLQKTLKLPVLTRSAEDRIRDDLVPLQLSFSVLRLSRTDAAEQLLVRMLLGSEADLASRKGPLVFPVFGRGRVLYALVGNGISATNLTKAAEFLIGACSCKVKEAHPGVDLLLTADWPTAPDVTVPPGAASVSTPVDGAEPERVPLPSAKPARVEPAQVGTPEVDAPESGNRWILGGIVGAALLTFATALLARRR